MLGSNNAYLVTNSMGRLWVVGKKTQYVYCHIHEHFLLINTFPDAFIHYLALLENFFIVELLERQAITHERYF